VQAVIAGIHHGDGQPAAEAGVRRLLDAMAYRPPDGTAVWAGGPVALGHGALAATPESVGGAQPVPNHDGTVRLVADARIDNRVELGRALGVPPGERDTLSDAAWILRAYEAWGDECADRLEGDFAFVLWDGPRRRLFGARDALGIKPFFYTSTAGGRTFRFASEPGALVGGADGIGPEPNLELMARYLLNRFGDPEATLYRGVRRLPGGATITVDRSGLRTRTYWRPDPEVRHDRGEECVERFRDLFGQAVADRLRAVGPVGAYLSGGLDSSAIVAAAPGRVAGFSLTFEGLPCDERPYIETVIDASGARPTYLSYADHRDALSFGQVGAFHDVMYGVTQYLTGPLAQAAQAAGVHTVLSGIGGDDILLPRRAPRSPDPLARVRRQVARARPPVTRRWAGVQDASPSPHHLVAGRSITLAVDGADRFAAAFGLEPRYPFLDRRLVDFALGLPDDQLRGEQTKLVLRRAMAGVLPEPVRTRAGKAEFSAVVDNELRGAQAGAVESLVATSRLVDLGVLHRARLRAAWDGYRAGNGSAAGRWTIQAVVGLELWHRTSIESIGREVTHAGHPAREGR
jgi:asparagine synthase (glutamine-hydrolysing)